MSESQSRPDPSAGRNVPAAVLDAVAEAAVVPSFTRLGYDLRRRIEGWTDLDGYDLSDRVVVITGGTSGIGRLAAIKFAELGATLILVGRSEERNETAVDDIRLATSNRRVHQIAADMGHFDQVSQLAERVISNYDRLDVLVHNAGALLAERVDAPDGTETTVASQVVGPFLLTTLLLDRLVSSASSRVLTMSSGGMYTAGLTVEGLEMPADRYRGAEQYARAKRAQVVLNEMWADRFGQRGVHFHALHPGWVDTPGVDEALPMFSRVLGPLLRPPSQGADTLLWLACDEAGIETNGGFWHDRRLRSTHRLASTRRSDRPERRAELWDWVVERSGVVPA